MRHCFEWLQHCSSIATLCCAKNRRCQSSRVTSPLVHCSSKKFERMARGAMDICLRLLKKSKKGRFYSCSVRSSILIISHITFRDCHVHIFSDNHSRNSCRVCSLTWPASIQIFWNKRKRLHKKKSSTPTGLVWDTNMAPVSLFYDTSMAAVTSCKNTLFCTRHSALCTQVIARNAS